MVKASLIRFSAQVSIALYVALLFAEYLRPGFVSTVMNVHVMWLVIVPLVLVTPLHPLLPLSSPGSGLVERLGRGRVYGLRFILLGVVLALIMWHVGEVFGGVRFWLAVAAGITPLALFRYPR